MMAIDNNTKQVDDIYIEVMIKNDNIYTWCVLM